MKKARMVLAALLAALALSLCCILTYFLASGAWQWLVTTIDSLIAQGPGAVVAAILAALITYQCLIPLAALFIFISVVCLSVYIQTR